MAQKVFKVFQFRFHCGEVGFCRVHIEGVIAEGSYWCWIRGSLVEFGEVREDCSEEQGKVLVGIF